MALAKAAGPELQAECDKKPQVAVGDIAVTGAGRLPCRYVFHTVTPSYDKPGGKAEKVHVQVTVPSDIALFNFLVPIR